MSAERDSAHQIDPRAVSEAVARQTEHLPERLASLLGRRLYRVAGLLFLLAILFNYLDAIMSVLLIAFVGGILAIAFNTVVKRIPLSRGWSTGIFALVLLGGIGVGIWFLVSMVVGQLRNLIEDLPGILTLLEQWEEWVQDTTGLEIELMGDAGERILDAIMGLGAGGFLAGAFGLLELVAMTVLVLVGALFVVAKPNEKLLTPLMRTVPADRRPAYHRLFERLGERISGWLWGTLVSMVIIGALSAIVFSLIGVPHPLLLGTLIGLADIVPLVGPWIGGAVAVIVTLFYDPSLAIWVAVAVIAIQELEGNLVRPMVMSGAANLHPFVTLLALILFGSMFGILGAILSLPIVLAIATAIEVLWVEETIDTRDDEIQPVAPE